METGAASPPQAQSALLRLRPAVIWNTGQQRAPADKDRRGSAEVGESPRTGLRNLGLNRWGRQPGGPHPKPQPPLGVSSSLSIHSNLNVPLGEGAAHNCSHPCACYKNGHMTQEKRIRASKLQA